MVNGIRLQKPSPKYLIRSRAGLPSAARPEHDDQSDESEDKGIRNQRSHQSANDMPTRTNHPSEISAMCGSFHGRSSARRFSPRASEWRFQLHAVDATNAADGCRDGLKTVPYTLTIDDLNAFARCRAHPEERADALFQAPAT